MAKPTKKAPALDEMLEHVFGANRVVCVTQDVCFLCGGIALEFRDDLSEREFEISGMCQECQDKTFGVEE